MRWPGRAPRVWAWLLLLPAVVTCPASAAPPAAPAASSHAGSAALPDYGGRDSVVPAAQPGGALNPMGQAWRAFEALAIVLAVVVGVLYGLKRLGLGMGGAAPAERGARRSWWKPERPATEHSAGDSPPLRVNSPPLRVIGSQTLPGAGGAALHLISVGERTLLLGATPQTINLLAEWESESAPRPEAETHAEAAAFAAYLDQAGVVPEPDPLLRAVQGRVGQASERLQSLLSKSRQMPETPSPRQPL